MHYRLESGTYLFLVLQAAKIVYINDSYGSDTKVVLNIPDPIVVFHFDYGYFFHSFLDHTHLLFLTSVLPQCTLFTNK